VLLESTVQSGTTTGFARFEWARKDELFPPPDVRHSQPFGVGKLSVGLLRDGRLGDRVTLGVGAGAGAHFVPEGLRDEYGRRPLSYTLFTRLRG
jgi:hypothetical protein